jgi:hypothetical protein
LINVCLPLPLFFNKKWKGGRKTNRCHLISNCCLFHWDKDSEKVAVICDYSWTLRRNRTYKAGQQRRTVGECVPCEVQKMEIYYSWDFCIWMCQVSLYKNISTASTLHCKAYVFNNEKEWSPPHSFFQSNLLHIRHCCNGRFSIRSLHVSYHEWMG